MIDASLSERIREARKALGLTQAVAAFECKVARETWSRYESGELKPGVEVLAALTALGADSQYILTGRRTYMPPPPTNAEEQALLVLWREASRDTRSAVLRVLGGEPLSRGTKMKFGGPVGQVNTGEQATNVLTTDGEKPRYGALHEPKPPRKRGP